MDKPKAILVDMDMTLCDNRWRHPYNFIELGKDGPIVEVIEMVNKFKAMGYHIVILTGRWKQFQSLSEKWLRENDVPYDECYFKPDEDYRHGYQWKAIAMDTIREKYDTHVFMDDDENVHKALVLQGMEGILVVDGIIDKEKSPGLKILEPRTGGVLFGTTRSNVIPQTSILQPPDSGVYDYLSTGRSTAPYNTR